MIMIFFFLISGIICLSNDKKYERKKDKGLRLEDPIEKKILSIRTIFRVIVGMTSLIQEQERVKSLFH